jgi:hypothetical protein
MDIHKWKNEGDLTEQKISDMLAAAAAEDARSKNSRPDEVVFQWCCPLNKNANDILELYTEAEEKAVRFAAERFKIPPEDVLHHTNRTDDYLREPMHLNFKNRAGGGPCVPPGLLGEMHRLKPPRAIAWL